MAFVIGSNKIVEWQKKGWVWTYDFQPRMRAFQITPSEVVDIPRENFIFEGYEGSLLSFGGYFDSVKCGVKFEAEPNLNTKDFFTVEQLAAGGVANQPLALTVHIPPFTPDGVFIIENSKEWPWEEWARISVFNPDTVAHWCLGFAYTMVHVINTKTGGPKTREERV